MSELLRLQGYGLTLQEKNRQIPVISAADLSVNNGEVVALIGESGSGKSMLWKSVLGLTDPAQFLSSGKIYLAGKQVDPRDNKSLPAMRGKDVAVILQDPMNAFDQVFTVGHHFLETARAHTNWTKKEVLEKAAALLRRLYIRDPEHVLQMYPFQCSGGMLQRIMIAMALMMDAPLLIADEPTTAVDVTVQREIVSLLREVNRERNTGILYISHDLKTVEELADRVYVMYAGYLVEELSVENLKSGRARHPYTQKLLLSRPSFSKEELPVLEGNPPALYDRPSGCPFRPRCEFAVPACENYDMSPAGREGRFLRCLRGEEGSL